MGSVHCRSDAARLLRRHIELNEDFHHNIRQVLRCASMRSASRTEFNTMWNLLQTLPEDDFISRYEIIDMLGCTTSRPLLNEFVRSAYNLSIYSEFEQYTVINAVLQNGGNLGIGLTLEFFIDNYEETIEIFGSWFVQNLAYYISNAEHIERFNVFQDILIDAGLIEPDEVEFNREVIERSVSWLNEQGEEINTWLAENFA
ncbi:aminopeptidase N-like [Bradysia coprophila]|nr:aminopeptidase N-like [Bradysia coprophila]